MGCGAIAGGGRLSRGLRLLLLLLFVLVAIEYLFGSISRVSSLQKYLYTTLHNDTKTITRKDQNEANSTLQISTQIQQMTNLTDDVRDVTTEGNTTETLLFLTNSTDGVWNLMTTVEYVAETDRVLSLCDAVPPGLGPITVNKEELKLDIVEKKFPEIHRGGLYTPPNCIPRYKVAIIVPYRDRQEHLAIFLNHMHPFLMKQQIEYGIFIVEQEGTSDFNRGKLMNVGAMESQKLVSGGWQCYIFHDVDLLPTDTRNLYTCPDQPRHLSAAIDTFNYKLPYKNIFGGVSAMTTEQFSKVNGFSNNYWGWGGEDDDMYKRLNLYKYKISRYNMTVARYTMLKHEKSSPSPSRFKLLSQTNKTYQNDGLNSLEYELVQMIRNRLYTYLLVNIDKNR